MDEREGAARFDAFDPIRTTATWLGIGEHELDAVPGWFIDAVAERLRGADPETDLREELVGRLHEAMQTLHHVARTDHLTGLANRRAVVERLTEEIARAKRYQRDLAVFILDVDDMKRVNDELGHPAGDRLLVEVARRVERAMRASDLPGRWGGDEFVLVCPETDGEGARFLAAKLASAISDRPLVIEGHILPVAVSVGFAVDGTTGDADSLLAAADAALYDVKQRRGRLRGRHALHP